MYCTHCGAKNDEGALFCTNCGASVTGAANNTPPAGQSIYSAYQIPEQPVQNADAGRGLAIASMICGIASLFVAAIISGTLGIVFGAMAKSKGSKSGMATAGIVCGIIGIALYVLMIVASITIGSEIFEYFMTF